MATRSKSSQRWLKEHFSDPFVKKAQSEGLRSRAAYKLEELLERDRLIKPGMTIVDLGAAPGGWAQMARKVMGDKGRVIALDILEMPSIAGVEFIHGDFREDTVLSELVSLIGGQRVDLVLSDMAPNMSGVDLIKAIRKTNPDVPVVVISSYDVESMRRTLRPLEKKHNLLYEINYFILEKPLMVESIKEIIGKII